MRVLVIGAGGRLGLRLLPALISHNHTPIAIIRDRTKFESALPPSILDKTTIFTADAESASQVQDVMIKANIDVFINCAGTPSARDGKGPESNQGRIGLAVLDAAKGYKDETGKVLRGWWVTGWAFLDEPGRPGKMYHDRFSTFRPEHLPTIRALSSTPTSTVAWTIACPAIMRPHEPILEPYTPLPRSPVVFVLDTSSEPSWLYYIAQALYAVADWGLKPFTMMATIPLVLYHSTSAEDIADRMVRALNEDRYMGHRVGSRGKRWLEDYKEDL